MAPDLSDTDAQDIAEVFDEDNLDSDMRRLAMDDEELNFDDMPDVYDVTKAKGDEDDEDGVIGDELDDEQIIELSLQDEDETDLEDEDDDYRSAQSVDDDDDGIGDDDEVALSFAGDLNKTAGAHSAAQRYEARTLSDEDLEELGYRERRPKEEPAFAAKAEQSEGEFKKDEIRLEEGLEGSFPASDPLASNKVS